MRFLAFLLALTALVGCDRVGPIQCSDPQTKPRYFVTVFAYESQPNLARNSHSFATFTCVNGQTVQSHTISWYPVSNEVNLLQTAPQPGKNMSLLDTVQHAREHRRKIFYMGSYEITQDLYQMALTQISVLESGAVKYHALGNTQQVCNCIHAISNIVGPLRTGASWGLKASRQIVEHFQPWIIRPRTTYPEVAEYVLAEVGLQGITHVR